MSPLVLVGAAILALTVAMVLLRVSSIFLLLAVMVGVTMQSTLGESTEFAVSAVVKTGPVHDISQAFLLLLPVALTTLLLRKSMSRSGLFLYLLPLMLACAALGIYGIHLLSVNLQDAIYTSSGGSQFRQAEDLIVALAGVLNLMLAWRVYRFREDHKHSKH